MKVVILGQLVIVQEAKVASKAEELRIWFGLRKLSGAVHGSYKLRSGKEPPGMKERVKKRQ